MGACLIFFRGGKALGNRFYRIEVDKKRYVGSICEDGGSAVASGTIEGQWDVLETFAESASPYFSINPAEVYRYAFDLGASVKTGKGNTYLIADDKTVRKLKEKYGNEIKLRHIKNGRIK